MSQIIGPALAWLVVLELIGVVVYGIDQFIEDDKRRRDNRKGPPKGGTGA